MRRRREQEALVATLREELAELREENARLRTQEQSAFDPHRVAAWLREDPAGAGVPPPSSSPRPDAGDPAAPATDDLTDVLDRQLQIELARQGLLSVCERLNVLSGQLQRELSHDIPAPEIDRRVRCRRAADDADPFDAATPYGRRATDRAGTGDAGPPHGRRATDRVEPTAPPATEDGTPHRRPATVRTASAGPGVPPADPASGPGAPGLDGDGRGGRPADGPGAPAGAGGNGRGRRRPGGPGASGGADGNGSRAVPVLSVDELAWEYPGWWHRGSGDVALDAAAAGGSGNGTNGRNGHARRWLRRQRT